MKPPYISEIISNLMDMGLKETVYRDPYYSNVKDIPKRSREYAGRLFTLKGGTGVGSLEEWKQSCGAEDYKVEETKYPEFVTEMIKEKNVRSSLLATGINGWEYAGCPGPPNRKEVMEWLQLTDGGLFGPGGKRRSEVHSQASNTSFAFRRLSVEDGIDHRPYSEEPLWLQSNSK